MLGLKAILIAVAAWCALVLAFRLWVYPWLKAGPGHDPLNTIMVAVLGIYSRWVHHMRVEGLDDLRSRVVVGPLIVVANHTGSVDPLLIQSACRFHMRWMMASEMMVTGLDWLWRHQRTVPVDRDGRDSGPAREAIRHVLAGGVIGIFPEGRIVAPPREIRPFATGIGLVVARTKAPVLLIWISGTPDTRSTTKSLLTPSHAHLQFIEVIDFGNEKDGHVITQRLRQRLAEVSGWPLNDDPMPRAVELDRLKAGF